MKNNFLGLENIILPIDLGRRGGACVLGRKVERRRRGGRRGKVGGRGRRWRPGRGRGGDGEEGGGPGGADPSGSLGKGWGVITIWLNTILYLFCDEMTGR